MLAVAAAVSVFLLIVLAPLAVVAAAPPRPALARRRARSGCSTAPQPRPPGTVDSRVLAAVSTENKILLGGMAAIFIAFSLLSSFYCPGANPNFPGERRNLFIVVTAIMFVGMLLAVELFAVEEEEEHGGERSARARRLTLPCSHSGRGVRVV